MARVRETRPQAFAQHSAGNKWANKVRHLLSASISLHPNQHLQIQLQLRLHLHLHLSAHLRPHLSCDRSWCRAGEGRSVNALPRGGVGTANEPTAEQILERMQIRICRVVICLNALHQTAQEIPRLEEDFPLNKQ